MSRPTKCIVDLSILKENYRAISEHAQTKVLALVKADAYGHGIIECSKALESIGADYLGVATLEEAQVIRENKIKTPILCIGAVPFGDEDFAVEVEAEITVTSLNEIKRLEKACAKVNKTKEIHIKIDSGMHRLGVRPGKELEEVLTFVSDSKYLKLKGAFTHFATSDSQDSDYTVKQAQEFNTAIKQIKEKDFDCIIHCSNSGAILNYPELKFDMVRAGIALYGYYPSNEVKKSVEVNPVLSFETAIIAIKKVYKGEKISYGCTFTAKKDMLVGVLPVGYGDGYKRLGSNSGFVLINGKKADIVGRICMDMTMVDITDSEASVGDKVILIGNQGEEKITCDDVALWCQTISYEIPLSITGRVKKHYVE